jgi:hypothetical protein
VIAEKFHTSTCYSEFRAFLDNHHIDYKAFSW